MRTHSGRRAMDQSGPLADGHGISAQELRFSRIREDFLTAVQTLLISCSRQDIVNCFAQFRPGYQDFLYKVIALTVTQIRENIVAEFGTICEERQVMEYLDHISSTELISTTDVRPSISPKDALREVAVKKKLEEVNTMKQTLQQAKEDNDLLATQVDGLRAKLGEAKNLRSLDADTDLLSSINLMFEKIGRDSWSRIDP